jgi:hypothetical protein
MSALISVRGFTRGKCLGLVVGFALAGLATSAASARETRSFTFKLFAPAIYSQDDNCPSGLNPLSHDIFMNLLNSNGKTKDEAEAVIDKIVTGGPAGREASKIITERGTFDGKKVNAYANPLTVPDPGFKTAVGRYAYGFDLDGKGATPGSFEDPETHQKGVDNGLFRVYGCLANHVQAPGASPNYPLETWEMILDTMPAWVLSVTGADLSKDGDVTVTIDRAINSTLRDAHGHVRHDQTFQIDSDPRSHTVFQGKIENGVLNVKAPSMFLLGDQFFLTEFDLTNVNIRLKLKEDGAAEGFLGGYLKWMSVYFQHAGNGLNAETFRGMDIVGLYHAFRRTADADPDPVTGQNTRLSSAWRIELVPAFVIPANRGTPGQEQTASAPQPQ